MSSAISILSATDSSIPLSIKSLFIYSLAWAPIYVFCLISQKLVLWALSFINSLIRLLPRLTNTNVSTFDEYSSIISPILSAALRNLFLSYSSSTSFISGITIPTLDASQYEYPYDSFWSDSNPDIHIRLLLNLFCLYNAAIMTFAISYPMLFLLQVIIYCTGFPR